MDPADRKTPPAPFPAAKGVRVPPPPGLAPIPALQDAPVPAIAPTEQSEPIAVPKAVKKWMPMARTVGPALVAVIIAIADGRHGKNEVSEKTDTSYETVAPKTNRNSDEIKVLKASVKKLTDTVELQGRLILSMQPGFTPAGIPAPSPPAPTAATPAARHKKAKHAAPPADPKLVAAVQANAVKTVQEIKQRVSDQAPATAPLPATIPAQAPPPPPPIPTEPPKQSQ